MRNKGVYEPEYRLLVMVVGLTSGVGSIVFGYITGSGKSYFAAATMHGMLLFGSCTILISSSAYVLDAFREMGNEIFIMSSVVKNFIYYGFTFFINTWVEEAGSAHVFYVLGGISFGLVLTTPILFVYGKRYRSFWYRHNLVEKFHLKTHAGM